MPMEDQIPVAFALDGLTKILPPELIIFSSRRGGPSKGMDTSQKPLLATAFSN